MAKRGGKRKAVRPARKAMLRGLPSFPLLAGAAALTVAAVGAVNVGEDARALTAGSARTYVAPASVLSGTTAMASSTDPDLRKLAVSRDSARQALADAADERLQKAAEAQARERNVELARLAASAEQHAARIASNTWKLPLAGYRLSASFGQCSALWARCHTGLDMAASSGSPILSMTSGVVTEAGYDGSYGNKTVVTLEDGTEIWYAHQTSISVSVGDSVSPGQVIGTVGSTGNSTGPHLHLEVRPGAGDPVDPHAAMRAHGVTP